MAEGAVQTKTLAWRLIVETQGIERNTRNAANSLSRFGTTIGRVATAFRGLIVVETLRRLGELSDRYTTLQNRLRLVTSNADELRAVQAELLGLSNRTRTDLESTADLYARSARALQDFGLSQREILTFTETVSQAIQVSGATAKEASQGVIQFAQGLSSGKLAGDELRAVLEQMPRLAKAITDGMGISLGQIRKLAAEGKITTEQILLALKKQAPEIAAEFATMTPTIASGFQTIKNSLFELTGGFIAATGAGSGLASMFQDIGTEMATWAPAWKKAGLAVREFVVVSTVGLMTFFKTMGPEFQQFALTVAGTMGQIVGADALVEEAIKGTNRLERRIQEILKEEGAIFDEIAADMQKARDDIDKTAADLDKPGTRKITPFELDLEKVKAYVALLDDFNKKLRDLAHEIAASGLKQQALNVEIALGKEAAADWLVVAEKRMDVVQLMNELEGKGLLITKGMADAMFGLAERSAQAENSVRNQAEAWVLISQAIEDVSTEEAKAAHEAVLLARALSLIGEKLSPEQIEAVKKRIKELTTALTDMEKLGAQAFKTLITGVTDFLMEGAQDVKSFVRGMIRELGKLVVQFLLVKAVKGTAMEGIFGAKGMVLQGGGLVPFAKGGVVTGPTTFPMTGGRVGIMGESGAEAVMPLARMASGNLGVRANPSKVEIINNTGVAASARIQRTNDRMSIVLEAAELGANLAEQRMTRSMRTGYGQTSATMQKTYALRRQG